MIDQARMAARFVWGLSGFLRRPPLDVASAEAQLVGQLADRAGSFLRVAERGIFGNPRSPYLPLLSRAGVSYPDLAALVRRDGLDAALATLHGAGVHVTLDEFKGRRPIRRPGLEQACRAGDFDNPLLARHYETLSGGSRGAGARLVIDLDLIGHEACHELVFRHGAGASGRPGALWRPAPPGSAGLSNALRMARLGAPPSRWFSPQPVTFRGGRGRQALLTYLAVIESRLVGCPIPLPEHVPLGRAEVVARWAAGCRAAGQPAFIDTNAASGVRVCLAALEHGLDIRGTLFRLGSEPFTPAKAEVVARAGCRAFVHYAIAEAGRVGVACTAPAFVDETHVAADKVAVVQRPVAVGTDEVLAFFVTSLLPSAPRIMLNVEVGDYGVLEQRRCGCPFDRLGFAWHLHTVRSYEKLTSEGMHFVGSELVDLVERVLPGRFGGAPTDYQLVEEETGGLPRVSLLISPRVGPLDERLVVETVLDRLASGPHAAAARMMVDQWRQGGTLRVVRREPYATAAGKVLSLHVVRSGGSR